MNKSKIHFGECPHCQNELQIRRLECSTCGLALEGDFAKDELMKLSADDLRFVHLFLRSEGSIRAMEKALGISYPTVKSRLAQINARLGAPVAAPDIAAPDVLDRLNDGDIDFHTALNAIKGGQHAGRD
jgi:hypothetical protein